MAEATTIRVSPETRDLLKEHKPYDSLSYDDYLRAVFDGDGSVSTEI